MTNELSNSLEFDKRRRRVELCPCGRSNKDGKFSPFKNYDDKGYCHSCGNTFFPNSQRTSEMAYTPKRITMETKTIEFDYVEKSQDVRLLEINTFFAWLRKLAHAGYFKIEQLYHAAEAYHLGTDKRGRTIFWLIGKDYTVRTAQIIQYDPLTGKRSQLENPDWMHNYLNIRNEQTRKCFYGEHLLSRPFSLYKPVAIVEAPKTAIFASLLFPEFIWLATCGANGIGFTNPEVCKVLVGRKVHMFPDAGKCSLWQTAAERLRREGVHVVRVFDFIEKNATANEIKEGFDLVDYRLKNNPFQI